MAEKSRLFAVLQKHQEGVLREWVEDQVTFLARTSRAGQVSRGEFASQSQEFLHLFTVALEMGDLSRIDTADWKDCREFLSNLSRSRGLAGFSPSETATFVFSLKRALFNSLRRELSDQPSALADETWKSTQILDLLGLFTTEVYQQAREEVIARQHEDMLELSTPVVKLWDGILALPLIGTLDSARTQVVMESLLQKIVDTNSDVAIIDITGVPTVDTLVAQHLIKTVTAARLMGAECIISGIRPQIAATIVHLGVDLSGIITKASLADAFTLALARLGRSVQKSQGGQRSLAAGRA